MRSFLFYTFALFIFSTGVFANMSLAYKDGFKVIAQGQYSSVMEPFVFVARDRETYGQLRSLAGDLPAESTIDFNNFAVVAGFAGERNTGGYSVSIVGEEDNNNIRIGVTSPGKDDIVTMVITHPFKLVLVPVNKESALQLVFAGSFQKTIKTYRVSKANFEFSGGFAYRKKQFKTVGTVGVMVYTNFATVIFDLKGKGGEKNRRLYEVASGKWGPINLIETTQIKLSRLDPGSFSDRPCPPFEVSGEVGARRLSMNFKSLPTNYADGFTGSGKLTAVKVG